MPRRQKRGARKPQDPQDRVILLKLRASRGRARGKGAALRDDDPTEVLQGLVPEARVRPLFTPAPARPRPGGARGLRDSRGTTDADADRYLVLTLPRGARRDRMLRKLMADPRVEYAVRPPVREVPVIPRHSVLRLTDPLLKHQWYLGAAGFAALWQRTSGLRWPSIAMLDTGVHPHPDIRDRVDIDVPARTTGERHGTMVSGVMAAVADNGIGIAGASRSRVIAFRVTDGKRLDYQAYYDALRACANDRIGVINISMAGADFDPLERDWIQRCVARGCIVVAAAGNHGSAKAVYPASLPDVIGVGAVDPKQKVWSDSGRGSNVWISAPGVSMLTTAPHDGYESPDGTSFAAPLVAAAVAGLWALSPDASRATILTQLRKLTRGGGATRRSDIGYGVIDLNGV